MAGSDTEVSFTILGRDQASDALASVGRSSQRAADDMEDAGRRGGRSLEDVAESSDHVASYGSQAAGALSGIGEVIGGPLGTGLTVFGGGLQFAADSGDLLNAATEGLSKRLLILGSTVLIVVAILAGIFLVLKYAYQHSETFRNAVDKLWAALKKAGDTIRAALQPYLDKFTAWAKTEGTVLINKLSTFMTTKLIPAIQKTADWIATVLIPKLAAMASWFNQHIMPAVRTIVSFYLTKLLPAWVKLEVNGIQRVISGVRSFIGVIRSIVGIVSNAVSGVRNRFNAMVSFIRGIPGRVRSVFSGLWSGLAGGIRAALNAALQLPLTIPHVSVAGVSFGGQTLIPRLAKGGIIRARPGGTLVQAAEAGHDEAFVPLDGDHALGGTTVIINVEAGVGDPIAIGREVGKVVNAWIGAGGRLRTA